MKVCQSLECGWSSLSDPKRRGTFWDVDRRFFKTKRKGWLVVGLGWCRLQLALFAEPCFNFASIQVLMRTLLFFMSCLDYLDPTSRLSLSMAAIILCG